MKERSILGLAAIAVVAVLAACGGGGGGGGTSSVPAGNSAAPGGGAAPTVPAGFALAKFAITIPKGSSGSSAATRKAQAIAAGTQYISLQQIQNNGVATSGALQGFSLTSTAPGCATVNANLTCTFSVTAQLGTDIFLATTYSSTDGSGPPLGSGAVKLSIQQNATNQANLTLTGPVQSIVVVSNNAVNSDTLWNGGGTFVPISFAQYTNDIAAFPPASPAPVAQPSPILSERLFIIAQDVSGNVILNPTTYNQPVVLTLSLNGGPTGAGGAGNVTLTNTQFIPCGGGTSTAVDGGTVNVCTPSDVVMMTLNAAPLSPPIFNGLTAANFPFVTASLAAPPANFTPTTFNLTAEVGSSAILPVTGQ